jgi:predicted transcriptional regulator
MQDDLSFKISDFSPEVDTTNTSPTSVIDRVLQKIREATERKETLSTNDLICDPHISAAPAAIRKSLQRLVKKGLIRTNSEKNTKQNTYTAVLACAGLGNVVPSGTVSSAGAGSKVGQVSGTQS